MTAHDGADIDSGQGPVVAIDAGKGAGNEACGRSVSRRMVVFLQVVVYRFRYMNADQRIVCCAGFFGDDA